MDFIIKKEENKASLIKAAQKLMYDERTYAWLLFLVDIQSMAIHLNVANTLGSPDASTVESIAFRATQLAAFFEELVLIEQDEKPIDQPFKLQ